MQKSLTAFLRSRKGVEIAASTMVILIISVVIFGYSIYFLFDMWKEVDDYSEIIDANTRSILDSLLRDPRAKVAIPKSTQEVYSGETATFWIGVKNIGSAPADFTITTLFDKAFSSDAKTELSTSGFIPDSWTGNFKETDLEVPAKQNRETFVLIKPDTQQKGVYTFKVTVNKGNDVYGIYSINVVVR